MGETLKAYLIQAVLKKYAPVGIMAAFTWLGTYLAAHSGNLEQWGITYGVWPFNWGAGQEPSGPCILIEMDTLSTAVIALVAAAAAIGIRAMQHHSTGTPVTITPKPQEAVNETV